MERKRYDMSPDLYLEIGTDRFHTAKLGPVTVSEILSLLRFATPVEAHRAARNTDEVAASKAVPSWSPEKVIELLMAAHAEYQSIHDDEEYEPFRSMKWMGISFRAKCDEIDLRVGRTAGEKGRCQVYVDHDAIDELEAELEHLHDTREGGNGE